MQSVMCSTLDKLTKTSVNILCSELYTLKRYKIPIPAKNIKNIEIGAMVLHIHIQCFSNLNFPFRFISLRAVSLIIHPTNKVTNIPPSGRSILEDK